MLADDCLGGGVGGRFPVLVNFYQAGMTARPIPAHNPLMPARQLHWNEHDPMNSIYEKPTSKQKRYLPGTK